MRQDMAQLELHTQHTPPIQPQETLETSKIPLPKPLPGQYISQAPIDAIPENKPPVPKEFDELGLPEIMVEDLIFKVLLNKGVLSGREIAHDICIHFSIIEPILGELKRRMLLGYRSTTDFGDFLYVLTESGREKAIVAREISAYAGAAPVPFDYYLAGVAEQSIRNETVGLEELRSAFSDLILNEEIFQTLGPAINSGRGMFLYGDPGNGKTSIAERICQCFKQNIFIPKSIWIDGQIVQLYDPQCHIAVEEEQSKEYDNRWILVKRPVVIVGGELTMESLEIHFNKLLRISEAPLQLKANGGIFLLDDFGRQRMSHDELLNRWIVPLEKRMDYLMLPNGKKIEVPFDELIIFSTNLNPRDLADEAFLRRIPYKINIIDPTEDAFRRIFKLLAPKYKISIDEGMINYLIDTHYKGKRPFRGCQPRDILEQVYNHSTYLGIDPVLTPEGIDAACRNYFTVMNQ
jgi:predicted ATPase with chaperone activity